MLWAENALPEARDSGTEQQQPELQQEGRVWLELGGEFPCVGQWRYLPRYEPHFPPAQQLSLCGPWEWHWGQEKKGLCA